MFRFVFSPPTTDSNKGMPNLDPEVLGNYRPVSNLPYLSKILERAVADQLQAHLDTNGLHVKFQSAYIRGHSTETALLRILNDLLVIIDGGNNAVLVLLDLSAAFDTLITRCSSRDFMQKSAWVVALLNTSLKCPATPNSLTLLQLPVQARVM